MAYTQQPRDEKALRRKRFLKRMEAKLRLKEAMQEHGHERQSKFDIAD